ncbi:MAG: family 10 glycosylhydrolase [Mediterranea sp.]|nr:family 10 glycosylhydrolase [Mediterranea sp.]
MKWFLTLLLSTVCLLSLSAASPKHEVRAVWVATLQGLDFPHISAVSPATRRAQQQELIRLLDTLRAAHFNTVLFQTRVRADVAYRSKIEPFHASFAGRTGADPGYDPLAFVVEECHKRGMECHAWVVTIPCGKRRIAGSVGYKGYYYLNPGLPQTKVYLMNLVREMVERYDIDGIQLDYLRYPERAPDFPDATTYRKYGKGKTKADWRRDNITEAVRYIYKGVKALKPWVKVSTTPVGKFSDTSRYSSYGWNAYYTVGQDVQGWLREGIQDQIYPMMYFRGNHFYPFVLDWQEQSVGRQVIPGLGIYFLDPKEGDWSCEEIVRQLYFMRDNGVAGAGFYRADYLLNNTQGIYDVLCRDFYATPALLPAMTWLDAIPPTAPAGLTVQQQTDGSVKLTWQPSTDNDTRNLLSYVLYASDKYPVDTDNPENIVAQGIRDTGYVYTPVQSWANKIYYTVTAVDRYGNESR